MVTESKNIAEDDDISAREVILGIQEWVRYLWSKWLVLLIVGLVGGLLGLWYAFSQKPEYTAATTFVIESGDSGSSLRQFAGMAALAGINLGGSAGGLFQGDNIMELYRSRTILTQTLLSKTHPDSNELLVERYISYNNIREGWEEVPELLALNFKVKPSELSPNILRVRDSVLTKFVNAIKEDLLTVDKPDRNLSIVRVGVTSPDEVFSKSFNENLVRRVSDFYIQTKTKKSKDNIVILENKVDSIRAVMERAIYSAARVSDATPNLNPTRQIQRVAPAQEAQFSAEANKAMLAQLLQNLELARMALAQEQPLIQLVDQPVYPLPKSQLGKIKGIIIGGFLAGFLATSLLIVLRWFHQVMREEDSEVANSN